MHNAGESVCEGVAGVNVFLGMMQEKLQGVSRDLLGRTKGSTCICPTYFTSPGKAEMGSNTADRHKI